MQALSQADAQSASRNDARSRRPGRPTAPPTKGRQHDAAMMPGHEDREDHEAPFGVAQSYVAPQ